jgi:predicted nucleotidyltransferase
LGKPLDADRGELRSIGMEARKPAIPAGARAALERFKQALSSRFGPRLEEFVLFGSVARGEAGEESDIDVLVVVDELTAAEKGEVLETSYRTAVDSDGEWEPVIALVMSSRDARELRERERLIMHEIAEDGIVL